MSLFEALPKHPRAFQPRLNRLLLLLPMTADQVQEQLLVLLLVLW